MSVFNLNDQNAHIDNKIIAGLERLSQVFRVLLWEKAKEHKLSPIQIQLLIFIQHHSNDKTTVSYLAQEFNLTKPTISDAIKVLDRKGLLQKIAHTKDARSYSIRLTEEGQKVVEETENFVNPLKEIVSEADEADKVVLWANISNLIAVLNKMGIISVQRTCPNCQYYSVNNEVHFCSLLNQTLFTKDIRMDCPEFEAQ